ncbi:MAG TPA: response regulator, partial [Solirubrobacteraceae bacterium]
RRARTLALARSLPMIESAANRAATRSVPAGEKGPGMARILLVDEDAATRTALRTLFEEEGYDVAEARDARAALDELRGSRRTYVALVDLSLPHMMGNVVLRELDGDRALARRHAYVATGTSRPRLAPDAIEALERLQLPFITKPYDLASL